MKKRGDKVSHLRVLENAGAIRFDRHRILISEVDTLRDLALL